MKQRSVLKHIGNLDEFLTKYRIDAEKGKIYNIKTNKEVGLGTKNDKPYYFFGYKKNNRTIPIKRCHLIFWSVHKYLPDVNICIDHVDGNPKNDSIHNLQAISSAHNLAKRQMYGHQRKSGYLGVKWHKPNKKYISYVKKEYKFYHLGCFKDPKQAAHKRDQKILELYWNVYVQEGFMPPLNFPKSLQKYARLRMQR